jgi:RHS repeat-associated protein
MHSLVVHSAPESPVYRSNHGVGPSEVTRANAVPYFFRAGLILTLSLLAGASSKLVAQIPASNSGQLSKFGAIQDFGTDSIDLSSLNVHLDIPIFKKAGRGLNLNSHVTHNNVFSSSGASQFGWTTALQNLTGQVYYTQVGHGCQGYIDWVYRDDYGTLHTFPAAISGTCGPTTPGTASDGTGLVLTPGMPLATVTGPNGATWQVASAPSSSPSPYVPSGNVTDANGNEITISTTGIIDTLGAVPSNPTIAIQNYTQPYQTNPGVTVPPETYTYTDAGGTSRQITINYGFYNLYNLPPPSPCSAAFEGPGNPAYANLPQSIIFPTTPTTGYSFSYESISGETTGRINAVTLPTGGTITYSYPTPTGGGSNNDCGDNGAFALNRTTSNGTWTYTRTLSSYVSLTDLTTTTTAVAPTGETTVYTFMYYPLNDSYDDYVYLETSKAVYQGGPTGTPLLLQQICYNGFAPPCANENYDNLPNASSAIISTTDDYSSYNGGPNSRTTTTYENPLYAPVEVDEYDFGASTPTRKTYTAYYSLNGVQTNKVSSVVVKDGNNTVLQQTTYGYDETAVVPTSGVPQHVPVSGNRGNLTSKAVWRTPDGALLTTTYTNDDTGNRVTSTDPCGNTTCSDMVGTTHMTTYAYADSPSGGDAAGNSNAYLTQVTYPNTGVVHSESYQYNYPSGQRTQVTDENNIVTNYFYNDPLNRLKLRDSAPGALNWFNGISAESKTTYNYQGATEVDVAQDENSTGDGVLTSSTSYDGLGRETKTVGRDGSVVETGYDDFNRVCAVSNPTFNDPGPLSCTVGQNAVTTGTDGYTYFSYDALGRKTQQIQPDGNKQQWAYNGNVVDFYDEDNSHWQRTSDAFGRLTKVLENDPAGSGALSLETDYVYNPLNDLTSVTQKGASGDTARSRTFAYNSLSQLTNACNPEAIATGSACSASGPWSASYSYDANGNVTTRTDARGIVTNYTYDSLNRILGKSYTNDPANTPALSYGYDQEYPFQVDQNENHPVDHLNWINATVGTTNVAAWASGDYDQRGNLTGYLTCLGSNVQGCPAAVGVAANIAYDLNDSVTGLTGTSGGASSEVAFGYTYGRDNQGRLNLITTYIQLDFSGNLLASNAFSGLTFYPGGAVQTANLAIDPTTQIPAIALSRTYDNRGRTTGEIDTNSQSQPLYSYSLSYDGAGNVTGYNDSVAGTWTVTNDALHRLSKLTGTTNGVASTIQETYDHFGNRNVETFQYGANPQMQPSPYLNFTAGNNRADSWSYDAAGNLLYDGTNNYLYDAENRLCAVQQTSTGGDMIGYMYGANGARLGKGALTNFTCDLTQNGMLTANGIALTTGYDSGLQGEQLEETDGNFNMQHYNVLWEGKLLGTFTGTTYDQSNWHFALNDWLGTKRYLANSDGTPSATFFTGPFGDYQSQNGTGVDPSGLVFTGKERDVESNLDYFAARHYNSNWGRFMTPDWSDDPDPVPYADVTNPQTLNLYGYVLNNPLSSTDGDGHDCGSTEETTVSSSDIRADSYIHLSTGAPCSQGPGAGTVSGPTSTLQRASQTAQNLAQEALNYLTAPRDTTCLAASAAHGAAIGAVGGGIAGGLGGAALGAPTGGTVSVPLAISGAAEGATAGGQFGFSVGIGIGYFSCATGGGSGSSAGGQPLKGLHSEAARSKASFDYWNKKSTQEIIDSLKPGQPEALRVKLDGTIMNGNTRVDILSERGVDINNLPREPY